MEFIRGKDLEELLTERGAAFPVQDVLQWADRLLEALEYLHGHDEAIIHRDIKPANLKLTPRGEIMLLDFGLAKGAAAGLQAASSVFGYTKQYAPLEQIKGKGTDARSDLFSLAATLYHLLTGEIPPDAVERVSEVAIGSHDPLKPASDFNRLVPASVSAVISRAMALKLDDRPATAVLMRQALHNVVQPPQRTTYPIPIISKDPATIIRHRPTRGLLEPGKSQKSDSAISFIEDLNGIQLEMIYIPGGKFIMGSEKDESERPPHEVTVSAFYIGKFQITQAQWKAVMGDKGKPGFKGDNLPMESVSWEDAKEFCQELFQLTKRLYRLPSEAEWEYACRAGTTTEFAFGDSLTSDQANLDGDYPNRYQAKIAGTYQYGGDDQPDYHEKTTPVGSFQPNAFGLYDMHGNVWEWCEDAKHDDYNEAPADGSAWTTGEDQWSRIIRGGSWIDDKSFCRSAYRSNEPFGSRSNTFGFRVVVST